MQVDFIIATYNRKGLVLQAIRSVLTDEPPPELTRTVIVVDNNSSDGTREAVAALMPRFGDRLRYIFEPRQGKSYALNTGIDASTGDLIAIIDDDEELDGNWFQTVYRLFQDGAIQYAGGRTLPKVSGPLPTWVPKTEFRAVIGWAEGPAESCRYRAGDDRVFLMGGNAVFRAGFLKSLGPEPYDVRTGRKGKRLLTADDRMYNRLLDTGAVGVYRPDLIVYHAVQPHMLTKKYYRRWCFWNGVSIGALERSGLSKDLRIPGLTRWRIKHFAISIARFIGFQFSRAAHARSAAFAAELYIVRYAGVLFGRCRPQRPQRRPVSA